jgi:hypothetical protein
MKMKEQGANTMIRFTRVTLAAALFCGALSLTAQTTSWTSTGGNTTTMDKVGIGTASPQVSLHVATESAASPRGMILQAALSTVNSPMLVFRKSRGTLATPTIVQNGDGLGTMYSEGWDGSTYLRSGASIKFVAVGTVATNSIPTDVVFYTGNTGNGNEILRLTSAGNVGIGVTTPNPSTKLHVAGNAQFDGTVTGNFIKAHYQDVAEWVPSRNDLAPGTVVVLDPAAGEGIMASAKAYDTTVAGVVSAQPGIVLGEEGDAKEQVATTGRVRVRVDASEGAIAVGDLLVTSDRPGYAMRSKPIDVGGIAIHRPGTIIGKALQPLTKGEGEILVLLSLQ